MSDDPNKWPNLGPLLNRALMDSVTIVDDPWRPDLSPEAMPEGWRFGNLSFLDDDDVHDHTRWRVRLRYISAFVYWCVAGSGPTPGAALAEAIRKAKDLTG